MPTSKLKSFLLRLLEGVLSNAIWYAILLGLTVVGFFFHRQIIPFLLNILKINIDMPLILIIILCLSFVSLACFVLIHYKKIKSLKINVKKFTPIKVFIYYGEFYWFYEQYETYRYYLHFPPYCPLHKVELFAIFGELNYQCNLCNKLFTTHLLKAIHHDLSSILKTHGIQSLSENQIMRLPES